jgi:hypothetical protein
VKITTCQICGRAIKANTGTIAHHGFKRPGPGWQTASCYGTHFRPYEVACDAIPHEIDRLGAYLAQTEAALAKHLAEPPETLTTLTRNSFSGKWTTNTYQRPADFVFPCYSAKPHTYENEYANLARNLKGNIQGATYVRDRLRKRLAEWKAPAEVA